MRRRTAAGLVSGIAALALVVGASIVWPGLDAQETSKIDTSVWALQTGAGKRYARVNTTVGELDTVRTVTDPSAVVQTSDGAFLFTDSFSKLTAIDAALPIDLDQDSLTGAAGTPDGTTDVATAGDYVAYLTDAGAVFVGRLSAGAATQIEPLAADGADPPRYAADAIAIDARGMLFSYSRADASVIRYDVQAAQVRGRDEVVAPDVTSAVLTAAADVWALVDADDGEVWMRGADAAVTTPTTGSVVVSQPDPTGDAVYVADDTGLVRIATDGSGVRSDVPTGSTVRGTPARPIVHDGEVLAAWLPQSGNGGMLWSSTRGERELDYGGQTLPDQRRPAFVDTSDAVILNETRSGWVWNVADARLVASSQDWSLDDRTDPDAVPSDEQQVVVIEPRPPVAEADEFGVREGSLATLPVLMNDHDPNEDVLSIDPTSVTGLDPGFGTLSLTDDEQRITVRVAPGATGSATFRYAVTDGTAEDGLTSAPTTVTLSVAPPDTMTAPQWCGVPGCLVPWPSPEVARGGTVTVPVLAGWVDPEGDPLLLLSVQNASGVGNAAASPSGDVIYQHSDDGAGGDQLIDLTVTVADTDGQTSTKSLVIKVSDQPALSAQSFAVVDTIDAGLNVDVAPHVAGTAGTVMLKSARVLDGAAASATIVGGSTTFDFTAQAPGTFRVAFTASDGTRDATATARITVLAADAPAQLATSPVVAFVRPQEDATLDVFAAVSNPTRRVLLLSDVVGHADQGSTLSVDAVGQNHLRVSGTTASGEPGRLGTVTYSVGDGTADQGARVEGEATVFLLPPAPELAPIAVDDTVVVRAGAQIDIPVLDNDIAPSGGRPTLNPASVISSSPDALAFASGDVIRYLAPTDPGSYTIDYDVYASGAPSAADTATVRLQVLPDDANRAPLPETLEGRVLSGQSTLIEFDGFGTDPDGDVVTLERILTQPASGSATISADGASILYSSVSGYSGQVSFRYRAVDAFGANGEGTVRIGVLDGESNPSPVTFTDYVQVQAGADSVIRVSPLANDVDPTMGTLAIADVRPDLPSTLSDGSVNPDYQRWSGQLRSVDDSTVVIAAGTEPATLSFLYDVESSSGNTGRGLIVVRVVRDRVPDYPVVADTVLTAENRDDFVDGVDVLTGKASWSGGNVDELAVSLWGSPTGVTLTRGRLRGELPATSRVIAFAVTAEGGAQDEPPITTYAFLRVPGDDDVSLSLRSSAAPQIVDELASVSFDMAQLVAGPRGSRIEVGDDVRASGARAAAVCSAGSGTTVRYDAGASAPWVDACQVPVRIVGQEDWTYLSVPIQVTALDPQPVLRPASITVGPGETVTYDLRTMTTWQLRDDWSGIRYALDYTGASFDVTLNGSIVTVVGRDRIAPGGEEAAVISVPSHTAVAPARLIIRVGAAPSTLPQGGSAAQQCSQAAGSSCAITVVGVGGEINPLPRTPLELVDVRPVGACVGVSFEVASSTTVLASWAPDAPGATCTATFTVQDAQGRRTTAERDGRLLLDLQGYPKAAASVVQTAYASGSLTLRIDPGEARVAYPALSGFVVRRDGQDVAQCALDGICPTIAAPNGEKRTYEVFSVNAIGTSRASVRTVAWAYDAPAAPTSVGVSPVVTAGEGGIVALEVEGIDPAETGSLEVTSPAGERLVVAVAPGQQSLQIPSYRVGTNTASPITVTPFSRFDLPPGLAGSPSGTGITVSGNGIGAPRDLQLALTAASDGNGTSTVSARGTAVSGGDGSSLRYGIVRQGETCRTSPSGATRSFSGLADGEEYTFTLCVESWLGRDSYGTTVTSQAVRATQSGRAPSGYTFTVAPTPTVTDGRAQWVVRDAPISSEQVPNRNRVEVEGLPSPVFDQNPGIRVRYVHEVWGTATAWSATTPAPGSAPFQVQATWSLPSCVGGADLAPRGDSSGDTSGGKAAIVFSNDQLRYVDATGAVLAQEPGTWTVPVGAVRVEGIAVSVSWAAQSWGLAPASATFGSNCTPNLPPP